MIYGKLVLTEYADETTVRMEYDALRRLVMLEDSLGITRIKRDEHGRIEEVEDPAGRKTDYTWGAHGERKSITTPDRKRTEYQYDNLMRLTSLAVAGAEPGDESIVRYIYDANGRLSQKEMPEGIKTTYLYNSR